MKRRRFGGSGDTGDSEDARRGAESSYAGFGRPSLRRQVSKQSAAYTGVLANELLATKLAEAIGLSVPACEVVEVTEWLIQNSKELSLDLGESQEQCRSGLQFGSKLIGG